MGTEVDADLPEVSLHVCLSSSVCLPVCPPVIYMNLSVPPPHQPPMPSAPEDESDEEKALRGLFDQLAGSVRLNLESSPDRSASG